MTPPQGDILLLVFKEENEIHVHVLFFTQDLINFIMLCFQISY